ncbi:TIGR04282 family arsenosugar biosynthesis glycosyltransferase [Naasia lichenicola]|uniref:DUF2064 domain-containing protein n=1 Tax=Naasia lichenicola TaxID=2565933 RepID=A0A4S4FIJ6_9MICO|nr:DUF2064 domain-containing protein [Naasia lichenicola]THG30173.1 DUF2064 domain-containing protein [Naasia lichenicola]
MTDLVVIAKACIPGRVKTRLVPPLTFEQAAELAAASLADTLTAMQELDVERRILYFDGTEEHVPDGASGFEVVRQVGGGLDARLGHIFDYCHDSPMVMIGMDTPQVTAAALQPMLDDLAAGAPTDAWFGPARDGGFWALGMARPDGSLIRGVPMSLSETGRLQYRRLIAAGLRVRQLAPLIDVDYASDAIDVAEIAPHGTFAARVDQLISRGLVAESAAS